MNIPLIGKIDLTSLWIGIGGGALLALAFDHLGGFLIDRILTATGILKRIADHADELIDKLQMKYPKIGKVTRNKLIHYHEISIEKLKEADGVK